MARTAYAPIFRSQVADTLREALRAAEEATISALFERRSKCLDYYHNEVRLEDGGKNEYLKDYSSYKDKSGMRWYKNTLLLEHVNLTERVIDLKSRIYREQPLRTVDGEEAEKYISLLKKSGWFAVVKRVEQYTNLLHDVALGIFLDEETKLLKFQLVPQYYPVFSENDESQVDPVGIIHPTAKRDSKTGGIVWVYYDDTQKAELNELGELIGEPKPNGYGVLPFIFSHRKVPMLSHFSTPAVDLVDANEAINAAITGLNQSLHYNSHKQMVLTGEVAETNEKGVEVQFALGNAQIINLKPGLTPDSPQPNVDVIDMTIDFTSLVNAIQSKMRNVFEAYNISGQYKIEGDAASGYSVDLQNAKDYEDRQTQFDVLEAYIEQPMFKIVSKMSEGFGLDVEKGELQVEFAKPKSDLSIQDKIAWQKWMRESGEWDLVKQIMENNPHIDESDAKKRALEVEKEKKRKAEEFARKQPPEGDNNKKEEVNDDNNG